jgi:parvulin-like peptidyl-prolyl isomerase
LVNFTNVARRAVALGLLAAIFAAGCGAVLPGPTATPAPTATPTITPTPTATPVPPVARVNGREIPREAYALEVQRCQAGRSAAGAEAGVCPGLALENLIEQLVVEQAAGAAGVTVSDDELSAALEKITADLGGPEAMAAWLTANLYTADQFQDALRRDLLRAKMAQQAASQIDDRAEQVHAREILVADEATAQALLEKLQAGADFATLAAAYSLDASSRPAGGDLGWFPRGLLTVPEVEAAAFNLQPGETSEVIHSALGYHIVEVLERQPARPLTPGALQALRERTFALWLERQRAQADIEKLIAP